MTDDQTILSATPDGRWQRRWARAAMRRGISGASHRSSAARWMAMLLAGVVWMVGAVVDTPAVAFAATPMAHVARTLNVKDEGHLHLSGKPEGSLIVEEGAVSGTLPGTVKVRFDVGATVTAQFTIYPRGGGSISGHGSGALHSTSLYSTFGGTLSVTSGTGRFKHVRGSGGLYGAINRKTDALTVQTTGRLSY
jgi:hypothetical protein